MSQGKAESGFTLVEVLVVLVVIGILAAIGIPRFLSHRQGAHNATAVADLRNLVVIETALEATTGLSETASTLAAAGWAASNESVRACAELSPAGDDVSLTVWHIDGDRVFTYTRSSPTIQANSVPIDETCAAQAPGSETVWPVPVP